MPLFQKTRISESDAQALASGLETLAPEKRPAALDILTRYRAQQQDLGEPVWPSQLQKAEADALRLRSMFGGFAEVDKVAPTLADTLKFSPDPDKERAQTANIYFLAKRYGKTTDEVSDALPFYRQDYAGRWNDSKAAGDDKLFYHRIGKDLADEHQKRSNLEEASIEGAKAALRGDDMTASLSAWQLKAGLERVNDSSSFTTSYQKLRERAAEFDQFSTDMLASLESNAGKTADDGKTRAEPASREQAGRFDEMLTQMANLTPGQRRIIYGMVGAKAEAKGYDQKGFFAQMLGELGKGVARLGSTIGTTATTAAIVAGNTPFGLPADMPESSRAPEQTPEQKAEMEAAVSLNEARGEIYDEISHVVSSEIDPVKPVLSWLNDDIEKGLIQGPGAVLPFMALSAVSSPLVAGAVFAADFAEQNRRDLRSMGYTPEQARNIGFAAAPLQAGAESLSNMLQLGRFPAVQKALSAFTKPIGGGAGLATRYLMNAGLSVGVEMTEEQLQDNFIVPAVQELVGALGQDVPDVPWAMYQNRAVQQTPELFFTIAPLALVFGGIMTAGQVNLSKGLVSDQLWLEYAGYDAAQASTIRTQPTEEARISKAQELWGARAGTAASMETAAGKLAETQGKMRNDVQFRQQELERRGILPVMGRTEQGWRLTFTKDGSTADFGTHEQANAARWQYAEDQLGRVHAVTREALASLETNLAVNREIAVELKPEARTAQNAVDEGADAGQMQRRVDQGKALGEVSPDEAFDAAVDLEKVTAQTDDYLSSLRILGSSKNEFKDGVLRTTIKLYEGFNPLTLVEEKLEGDAKQIITSKPGRAWLLSSLRNYEQESGDKLFRDVADDQLKDDDLAEAWSHLGQSYLLGRSTFGEPLQKKNLRRFLGLVMRSGLGGALNAESEFWRVVASRAQKLAEMKQAGKLSDDLVSELEHQLGIDSQLKHETAVTDAVAAEMAPAVDQTAGARGSDSTNADGGSIPSVAATAGGSIKSDNESRRKSETPDPIYSEENPGPNGETFSLAALPSRQSHFDDRVTDFASGKKVAPPNDERRKCQACGQKIVKGWIMTNGDHVGEDCEDILHRAKVTSLGSLDEFLAQYKRSSGLTIKPAVQDYILENSTGETFSLRKFPVPPGLAEAAQKARGESSLILAYQQAQRGSSSAMVPISAVYEAAKKHSPALTPAAFMAQINALNDSGAVLIGLSETTKAVEAAGAFRVGGAGTEMAFAGGETFSLAEPSPGGLSEAEDREMFNAIMKADDPGDVFSDKVSIQRPGSKIAGYFLGSTAEAVRGYGDVIKRLRVRVKNPLRLDRDSYTPQEFSDEVFQKTGIRPKAKVELHNDTKFREPVYTFFSPGMLANDFDSRSMAQQLTRSGVDAVEMLDDSAFDGPRQDQAVYSTWIPYPLAKNIRVVERVNPESSRAAGGTFSLRSGDFSSRMAAAFSPFQRSPELRRIVGKVAYDRTMRLKDDLLEKANIIRPAESIESEKRFREADSYDRRVNAYLDSLSPEARQTLEWTPDELKDDPLIAAMLDFGKLMSRSTAMQSEKVTLKVGDYDGVPWLPPSFYSKGAGIMPDQMAQAMHDAGLLPDAYVDTLWQALASRIASSRKNKAAHREAVAAFKEAQKAARVESKMEAEAWANQTKKEAGTPKAQRERLKAWLRILDGILAAAPPEVRAKVGGYIKLAGLATDEAMLKEIEKRVAKLDVELSKWLKKEGIEAIEKLFKKAAADFTAGKKAKGKLGPDEHHLFQRAKAAAEMTSAEVLEALAALDTRIASDDLTPEQEALAILESGIIELVGDLKNADAGRVYSAIDELQDIYDRGRLEWTAKLIAKREARAALREALKADTGKSGVKKERQAMDKLMLGIVGKIKSGWLSLSSFHELLNYSFGSMSQQATALVDAERNASNEYEDGVQALADDVEALFTSMAGGKVLDGEKLRFDMAQRSIDAGTEQLSQLEAIQALLMWRQEDGQRHMEGTMDENGKVTSPWSYDQAWIDNVESQLTPEARRVMAWIVSHYSSEHAELNALYRERHGVNLPQHDNYAPLTVKPIQTKAGEMTDPVSGAPMSGSILTPGSLRTRSRRAIAEPDFRDALQTLIGHKKQMGYWKAYYDLAVEAQAVLGNRDLMNSVHAAAGDEAVKMFIRWVDVISMGGTRDAAAGLALTEGMRRMTNRAATVGLLGRVSTLLVQSTQLAAASVKMPVGAYLKRFSKLMTGNLAWGDAMRSPFIQRRIQSAPPIVRQAMANLGAAKRPNQITRSTRFLGQLLSGADGLFTGGTYAILLDYHRETGAKMGLTGAELEAHAHTEAERATEQVAQPTRTASRSMAELTATHPLTKVGWAYVSEARQKLALFAWASSNVGKDPGYAAKVAFLTFVVGGLMTQVLKNLWRDATGDDDEKKWSPERLALAALSSPMKSIPFAGAMMGDGGMLSGFPRAKSAIARFGDWDDPLQMMRDIDTLLSAAGLFNDTAAGIASLSHVGLDAAKLIQNLASEN